MSRPAVRYCAYCGADQCTGEGGVEGCAHWPKPRAEKKKPRKTGISTRDRTTYSREYMRAYRESKAKNGETPTGRPPRVLPAVSVLEWECPGCGVLISSARTACPFCDE